MEFEHGHAMSIVDQREVGLDTHSFEEALRHAMREAPDVIMIGEIRDRETMQHALAYAETGHLCVSTMHANNANQAIQRILNFFPETAHRQVLMDLSLNLKGVVGQRLIRGTAERLVPAVEVMLLSPYIADLIQKGQVDDIKDPMSKSAGLGMCTFDQSLYDLYERGDLTAEQAIEHADSRTDLSLRIRLSNGMRPDTTGLQVELGGLTVRVAGARQARQLRTLWVHRAPGDPLETPSGPKLQLATQLPLHDPFLQGSPTPCHGLSPPCASWRRSPPPP